MTSPSEIRWLAHSSELLRGNPMGDPHERRLPAYLPPGYDPERRDPYPVVFVLSGWGGRGARYLDDGGAFSHSLPEMLDRRILSGEMPPVIVPMPDGTTRLGASQYVNSAANGPYMDYLCDELVPFVDRELHTHASADFRGILGHSSGGFGALVTCMLRPDRFRYVLSSAGDGWYEWLYVQPIPTMMRVLSRAGGVVPFIEHFLGSPNPKGLLSPDENLTMMNLSMCTCYAPNLGVPVLKGDLYFDLNTGELQPDAWRRFLAWDPVLMAERHVGALRQMRFIRLEAGNDDEYALHVAHRQLAKRLAAHGIVPTLEEYPGRHGGHHYRMAERIGRMLAAMAQ